MKQEDPDSLVGMFEGGIKKVAPTMITGVVLVVAVLLLLPDPTTQPTEFTERDVLLTSVTHLPDGGTSTTPDPEGHPGDQVRVAANLPFAGTVKVYRLDGDDGVTILPKDSETPERSSAGRMVELGDISLAGDAGVQTWMLSLCPLGAEAAACFLEKDKPMCPTGCLTATMRAHVSP
jgi:hypothetical protein